VLAWSAVRNIARQSIFATRVRTGATVLVCGAVAAAAVGYGLHASRSSPASGVAAETFGMTVTRLAEPGSSAEASSGEANLESEVLGSANRQPAAGSLAVATGRHLVADHRLMLAPAARSQLIAGIVDGRIIAALRLLLDRHVVDVTSFGTETAGKPLRMITISCLDERPIDVRSKRTADVLAFFGALGPELAPRSVRVTTSGKTTVIVATYPGTAG
jgi:hypothetical protein